MKLTDISGSASFLKRNPHLPAAAGLAEQCEATPEVKAMTRKVKLENELRGQCEDYFNSKGWLWFTSPTFTRTLRREGEVDYEVAADNGLTFWIELKRPGGKRSKAQCEIAAWLIKLKQRYILADTLEDVIRETRT